MGTLSSIVSSVNGLTIDNGTLTITPADFSVPFMDTVFSDLLGVQTLTFSGARKSADSAIAMISGSADLFGYTTLQVTLKFSNDDDGNVLAQITAIFAEDDAITIPVLTWIAVDTITISTSVTENVELVDFSFALNFVVENGDKIPVAITRQSAKIWDISVAEDPQASVTADDLVQLLGGAALEEFLPLGLTDALAGIVINNIDAGVDVGAPSLHNFTTTVSVTNGWAIVPGAVELVAPLDIGLTLSTVSSQKGGVQTGDAPMPVTTSLQAIGKVDATFLLGGVTVPITVGATVGGGMDVWQFGIQPGQAVVLPSFSDLLELAGGQDFMDTLPSGLSGIPSIKIDRFMCEFDVGNKELTLLTFALATESAWPVIADYFEIDKLSVDFKITNLTTPTKRKVIGDLYAQFKVGPVPLFCELRNTADDQDWTVSAGLPKGQTLDIVEIAAQLFSGGATLPDDLPSITFTTLTASCTPAKQTFKFAAGSTDTWTLLSGFDIKNVSTAFSYTGGSQPTKFSGDMGATFDISGVTLALKAALNDAKSEGWTFSGQQLPDSNPIPVGQLIQDLASIFGDIELPTILTGLTVENLGSTFNTKTKNFTFHMTLKDTAIPELTFDIDIKFTNKAADTFSKEFSGTLIYKSTDIKMEFKLDFISATTDGKASTQTNASYTAQKPPTLQQFLLAISNDMGWDANLPAGLNFDAAITAMTLDINKPAGGVARIDGAGQFDLTFGSGDPWTFYVSYSNDTYFDNKGKDSRAMNKAGTSPAYVFGTAVSGVLDLSKLPLIGDIPGIGDFSIDKLGFYYTDAPFSDSDKKLIYSVAKLGNDSKLAPDPATAFLDQTGFSLNAQFGNQSKPSDNQLPNAMPLGTFTGTPAPQTPPTYSNEASNPRKPISWLNVNKTIGPVDIAKVGLTFAGPPKGSSGELGILGLYISGGFTIAGLTLYLDGLGITFPLPSPIGGGSIANPMEQIGFHLAGAYLELKEPGFEIAGGFLSLSDEEVNMIGTFTVKIGPFGVSAYGGFAGDISDPSLFIFMHLNAPLGGPPFLFVTGISGGFGVNRNFVLPTFDELATYPLLPSQSGVPTADSMTGQSNEQKLNTMTNAMLGMAHYFPVDGGQYWFAFGIDVTSFEMIDVSAIVSVAFGKTLQFAVIGSAGMSLPNKVPEPLAYVQINFMASYSSSDDLLAVQGALTPSSYIYEGLVKLSGGFAFYVWLDGPHLGDFVLTIGGYSAHYTPPSNYPNVPRVGVRAGIGVLNIIGEGYLALVPNALMAGLSVQATVDLGPIKAWFYVGADFYLGWKPFHYEIDVGVTLGASFTIDLGFVKTKITIHVGVMLSIWGPSFGGKVVVDLDIISFTIAFGGQPKPAPAISWGEFKGFLPSTTTTDTAPALKKSQAPGMMMAAVATDDQDDDTDVDQKTNDKPLVTISIKTGLLREYPENGKVGGLDWLVDANHFNIFTTSTAPITQVDYNGTTLPDDYNYLTPGNLAGQIASSDHKGQDAPYYVYETPKGVTPWHDNAYGIPPMHLTDIRSFHTVTLYSYVNGVKGDAVDDVIITLTTGNVALTLWGNEAISTKAAPKTKGTIANALLGLAFTPMIWSPKRTVYIPYYYLVFNTNNLFLQQGAAPVLNAATIPNPDTVYAQMQDGSLFQDTQTARSNIVDALRGVGFGHLTLSNSDQLRTQDYVADPMLGYMSSTNETQLGAT